MSAQLAKLNQITFHDSVVTAFRHDDGRIMVALQSICTPMGLDTEAQRQKLSNAGRCPWARGRTFVMQVHDVTGKLNDLYVVDLKILPMWLATITASRVRKELRPKVELFQNECAEVLERHFLAPRKPQPATSSSAIGNCPYTKRMAHVASIEAVIPKDHWCVFLEGSHTLMKAQTLFASIGVPMDDLDLMDGSMGLTYAAYRTGKPWAGIRVRFEYDFPHGDPRGKVFPWAYPLAELQHFRVWAKDVYWPTKFPPYALNKYRDNAAEYKKLAPAMQAVKALAAKT